MEEMVGDGDEVFFGMPDFLEIYSPQFQLALASKHREATMFSLGYCRITTVQLIGP